MKKQNFIILLFLIITVGCIDPGQYSSQKSWAEQTLNTLTLREKIGQMMLYGMHMKFMNVEDPRWQELKSLLKRMVWVGSIYGQAMQELH